LIGVAAQKRTEQCASVRPRSRAAAFFLGTDRHARSKEGVYLCWFTLGRRGAVREVLVARSRRSKEQRNLGTAKLSKNRGSFVCDRLEPQPSRSSRGQSSERSSTRWIQDLGVRRFQHTRRGGTGAKLPTGHLSDQGGEGSGSAAFTRLDFQAAASRT
jgi:hypothetical protein